MRVAIACDHGGFPLKASVVEAVRSLGHEVVDFGVDSEERVDYPDFAEKAGRALQRGEVERAILICASGIGVNIAANKMQGVYAGVCHDTYSAHQGVEHDNMNTLCLGGRIIGPELAKEIVRAFLMAKFLGEDRYRRRFEKVRALENEAQRS
ncbi:ribose 5-phosphate isomerase B [uncultured Thermanaerothrix sp.]|uniref:ribose 5-phosphate isomerase B n=1 Tax=uncultured Thermanaerothrix sp. TaxID=1195149 RepID=UPI00262AC794|nr:ribose 5-phosphate isomerase B [uncultured Thermanaerothrix sp.]